MSVFCPFFTFFYPLQITATPYFG